MCTEILSCFGEIFVELERFHDFTNVFSIERRVTHTIELIFNSKNVINPNINWSVVSVHRIFELLK